MASTAALALIEQIRADAERTFALVQPVLETLQRPLVVEALATAAHLQPLIDDIVARKPSEVYLHVHK